MASPRSSTDEGEIVERQPAAQSFKAKTSATASSAAALTDDGVDRFNVDRRNRNPRGRASRSPDRAAAARGQKRPRDDRGGSSRWSGDHGSGGRRADDRYEYDDAPREGWRRGNGLRYDDNDNDDTRDRNYSSSAARRERGEYQRYDDRAASGKRQRTRSRSPPPSRAGWSRNGRNGRGDRDHHDRDRDRDGDFDRRRDRDPPRDNRDRVGVRFEQDTNRGHPGPSNGQKQGDQSKDSILNDSAPAQEPKRHAQPPPQQEDYVERTPIDEEAEIRRRRQRREELLRKSRASTPLLQLSLQTDRTAVSTPLMDAKTAEGTPVTAENSTPRSVNATAAGSPSSQVATPAELHDAEAMNLANDQDFMNMLSKHGTSGNGMEDGPSAADYDPTMDMEEDERRDELRHGGTAAGLHGADFDRREALAGAAEDDNHAEPVPASDAKEDAEDEGDDDDDMFAEDFVEKKYVAPKADAVAGAVAGKDGALPTAAANAGGILDGDDIQGYYKIRRGEVLDGRYQIQSALGKGMFSGVARAWDITTTQRREVAIKIMRNNDALRKGGYTEIAILQKLNEADPEDRKHIVRFERSFEFRGHLCMAFENLSMNLREVLKKFGNNVGINLQGVRVYAYQIFVALAHMRRCSVIHADLKPDNILVNDSRSTLKICDLGTAIDRSDAATAHMEITPYLVSRFYRAPEIILGMPYDYGADTWSIGCTLYELYTGKILFTGESNNQMLRAIMEVRGKISAKLYRRGELWPMHFDDSGGFLSHERDKFQGKTTVKTLAVIKPTRDLRTRLMAASAGLDDAETKELNLFHDLLDRCLSLNPDKRILPADALKHPFFTARARR